MNTLHTKLPLYFRQDLCTDLFKLICASESASIIGTSGVGKSNLFNHLLDSDVQQHYLGEKSTEHILIRIDGNDMLSVDVLGLYSVLLDGLENLPEGPYDVPYITAEHDEMLNHDNHPLWMRRHFERAIRHVMKDPQHKLIILFDQFDGIYQNASSEMFRTLRSLREKYKYRISYLVFVRDPLYKDMDFGKDKEEFYELLSNNTLTLGFYNETDGLDLIKRVTSRIANPISDDIAKKLYSLSGGHAGILRALLFGYIRDCTVDLNDFLAMQSVIDECHKLWNSLGEDEQLVLSRYAVDIELSYEEKSAFSLLKKRSLLDENQLFFCKLFHHYVIEYGDTNEKVVQLVKRERKIRVYGVLTKKRLTPIEFALFECLYENANELVTRDELALAGWGEHDPLAKAKDYKDHINVNISRLRKKLKITPQTPDLIDTKTNYGFVLRIPER